MNKNRKGRRDDRFGRTARQQRGNVYSRTQVLRGAGVAVAGIGAAAVGLGGVAKATTWVPEVTLNADDYIPGANQVDAIQEEVNLGGNILLVGSWDFQGLGVEVGRLGNGVTIKGDGTLATKIVNGWTCFKVIKEVNCTIENIHFDLTHEHSILVDGKCGDLIVRNTKHTNHQQSVMHGQYIWVRLDPDLAVGNVLIEGNDCSDGPSWGNAGNIRIHPGSWSPGIYDATFIIKNNSITASGGFGIDVGFIDGNVFIDNNNISNVGSGIINGMGHGYNVTRNTISNAGGYGILLGNWGETMHDSLYKNNTIAGNGAFGMRYVSGEGLTFQGNIITGSYGWIPFLIQANNSVFIGNNVNNASGSPNYSPVTFLTYNGNNTWVGVGGIVSNGDPTNKITGSETWTSPMTPELENAIAQAAQQMDQWNPQTQ